MRSRPAKAAVCSLIAAAALQLLLVGGAARAQQLVRAYPGGIAPTRFGAATAIAGDLDGDGFDDVLVGEPLYDDVASSRLGRVCLFSGVSGVLLRTHPAITTFDDHFGHSVASVGDLDGDGVPDYAAGGPSSADGAGVVAAFSGATGAQLWAVSGTRAGDALGWAVAGVGDLDGDGRPEVLVSRVDADAVDVLTSSGALLYTVVGQQGGMFGYSLAGLGDVNGDGVNDFAGGEPTFSDIYSNPDRQNIGRVRLFSGVDGALLWKNLGPTIYGYYGWSISRCGDYDGDGVDDLVVGAPYADASGSAQRYGYARIQSIKRNAMIREIAGTAADSWLGAAVAGIPDFDLDGVSDYLVGEPGANGGAGSIRLFSGRDGALRFELAARGAARFGETLAGGDFDHDGIGDWLVGQPLYVGPSGQDRGGAFLFRGAPARASGYGIGWEGTLSIPSLDALTPPAIGTSCEIRVGNSSPTDTVALLFVGFVPADLVTSAGGSLLVAPAFSIPLPVFGDGVTLVADVTDDEALCSLTLYLQAIERDGGASDGISFTPGLALSLGFALQ